jgi:hypothetical protein
MGLKGYEILKYVELIPSTKIPEHVQQSPEEASLAT